VLPDGGYGFAGGLGSCRGGLSSCLNKNIDIGERSAVLERPNLAGTDNAMQNQDRT
jgi:hypothetical protein